MVTGDLVNMVQTMTSSQAAEGVGKKKKKMYPQAKGLVQ